MAHVFQAGGFPAAAGGKEAVVRVLAAGTGGPPSIGGQGDFGGDGEVFAETASAVRPFKKAVKAAAAGSPFRVQLIQHPGIGDGAGGEGA